MHFKNITINQYILQKQKNKRGGTRLGSGAKPKYNELTKTIAFRVPVSKIDEVKQVVKSMLECWSLK